MQLFDLDIVGIDGFDDKPYILIKAKELEFCYWDESVVDIFAEKTEYSLALQKDIFVSESSELVQFGWQIPMLNKILSEDVISLIKSDDIYYLMSYLQIDFNPLYSSLSELRILENSVRKELEVLIQGYSKYNHYINSILKVLIYEGNAYVEKLDETTKAVLYNEETIYNIFSNNYGGFLDKLMEIRYEVYVDTKKVERITQIPECDANLKVKITPALISFFESRNEFVMDMRTKYEKYLITLKAIEILESNPKTILEVKKNPNLKDLEPKYQILVRVIAILKAGKEDEDVYVDFMNEYIKYRTNNPIAQIAQIAKYFYNDIRYKYDFSISDTRKATRWIDEFVSYLKIYHPAHDWSFLEAKLKGSKKK